MNRQIGRVFIAGMLLGQALGISGGALAGEAAAPAPPEPAKRAEADQQPAPFFSDRPLKTLPTDTLASLKVQFETGFDFATFSHDDVRTKLLSGAPTRLRLGIHERIELYVDTDAFLYNVSVRDGVETTTCGFADVAAGLKLALFKGGRVWGLEPSTTVHASLTMPAGTSGFTANTWMPKAVLAFSWKLPADIEGRVNIGSMLPAASATGERYHQGVYGVALQRNWAPLTTRVGNFLEAYGMLALSGAAVTTAGINGGFFFILDDRLRVDLNCRAGVYGDNFYAPKVAGGIGFTIKL